MADTDLDGERKRVLVGVTGSVAAIKLPELVELLQKIKEPQARHVRTCESRETHQFQECMYKYVIEKFCMISVSLHRWRWRWLPR